MKTRTFLLAAIVTIATCLTAVEAAELSVADATMRPGETSSITVQGKIEGDATFGVTILVTLVPREGAVGSVRFTPATPPPSVLRQRKIIEVEPGQQPTRVSVKLAEPVDLDIVKLGDPFAAEGSFTKYDTDQTKSDRYNGCVLDNGTFLPAATTFNGPVAGFGVVADADASGAWDVVLRTKHGASGWEAVETTLITGTLIVVGPEVEAAPSTTGDQQKRSYAPRQHDAAGMRQVKPASKK